MKLTLAALAILGFTTSASMAATCYGRYGPYHCHVYHRPVVVEHRPPVVVERGPVVEHPYHRPPPPPPTVVVR
jgi:hypothetical protein